MKSEKIYVRRGWLKGELDSDHDKSEYIMQDKLRKSE